MAANQEGPKQNREFSRVPLQLQAELKLDGRAIPARETLDLSMNGVLVRCAEPVEVGSACSVVLYLLGRSEPLPLEIAGRVERITDTGVAVRFTGIGLESFEYLKNLVRYNSPNPDEIEGEIDRHLGLKPKTP